MAATEPLLTFYQTTPHDIPDDSNPHSHSCENLKCHKQQCMPLKQSFIVGGGKHTHTHTIAFMNEIIALKLWIYPSMIYKNYLLTILQHTTTQWLWYWA